MQDERGKIAELWKGLQNAGTTDDLVTLLRSADEMARSPFKARADIRLLRLAVFRAAMQVTRDDPEGATAFVSRFLLPVCLHAEAEAEADADEVLYRHQTRSLMGQWINGYSDSGRALVREPIYKELAKADQLANPTPAIWAIASLGFRFPGSQILLHKLQEREDHVGDAALCAEAALGNTTSGHRKLVDKVLKRIESSPEGVLNAAIQDLADPKFIPFLAKRKFRDSELFRQSLLGRILAAHRRSPAVRRSVWHAATARLRNSPKAVGAFLLSAALAEACDLPDITTTLLSLLATDGTSRFHVYTRLEECILPAQVRGWKKKLSANVISVIHQDAANSAGGTGPEFSLEQRVKHLAWETALSAGLSEAGSWANEAIAGETSPYVIGSVAERIACISLAEIPEAVLDWAKRDVNLHNGQNVENFAAANGTLKIAASAASTDALKVLLHTGLRTDGGPLRSTAELVGDVSCWLARSESEKANAIRLLLEEVKSGDGSASGQLAASGLRALAINELLEAEFAGDLFRAARSNVWPNYFRARLIESIGWLRFDGMPADITNWIIKSIESEDSSVKWASIEAAVRLGLFPGASTFRIPALEAEIARPEDPAARSYVLSLLLRGKRAERFVPAAVNVIESAPMASAWALLSNLDGTLPANILEPIGKAVSKRIRNRQTNVSAELGLFDVLANLGPRDLVAGTEWPVDTWLPSARAALADAVGIAMGMIQTDPNAKLYTEKAAETLQSLLEDGIFAVRRAAARSLANLGAGQFLCDVGLKWARSGATDLQKRAAEAAVWLPAKEARKLLAYLAASAERDVRQAVAGAAEERWRRDAAKYCMGKLLPIGLRPSDDPTKWVLDRYALGRGIIHLGDNYDLQNIRDAALAGRWKLPPNVNHWLRQLVEGLEEQWTATTRKWPEPWLPWRGVVEEFSGKAVILAEGKDPAEYPVRYALWSRHADSPAGTSSWGGSMRFESRPPLRMIFGAKKTVTILADGREKAEALITESGTNATWLISGNGKYPERQEGT